MDLLNDKIKKDRIVTYQTREMILKDLLQTTFKIIAESTDPVEIKAEAAKLVDYRLQLIEVQKYLRDPN
ncbi:hypothetical protein [Lactobacillus intestinalis]|uniref:hypothetical protein n=1 Tax=Lactobacillus intestinalis TaxID=151781 RepID=UPI0025A94170|nr:hypothetical protein [Lactobacillus intestinalis]